MQGRLVRAHPSTVASARGDRSKLAAGALVVGSCAQLVGQGLLDSQGRDLRAAGASETLWVLAHLSALIGVVALTVGAAGLTRSRPVRLAAIGRVAVLVGACAAGTTLLYDVALGASAMTGAEIPAPRGVGRSMLQLLDTLDFALVVGLVLVVVAWGTGARSRLGPSCAAMGGLSVPALAGIETIAAGSVFVGFVVFATFLPQRGLRPLVERLTALTTVLCFAAAGFVSVPRALLACIAVPLVVWMAGAAPRDPSDRP